MKYTYLKSIYFLLFNLLSLQQLHAATAEEQEKKSTATPSVVFENSVYRTIQTLESQDKGAKSFLVYKNRQPYCTIIETAQTDDIFNYRVTYFKAETLTPMSTSCRTEHPYTAAQICTAHHEKSYYLNDKEAKEIIIKPSEVAIKWLPALRVLTGYFRVKRRTPRSLK